MRRQDFTFNLPPELIARHPLDQRRASRMLHLPAVLPWQDRQFADLPDILQPGDLLVMNNSKVIPARMYGQKSSGGRVEVLLERIIDARHALVKLRASKSPKPGADLTLVSATDSRVSIHATMTERRDDLFVLQFETDALSLFEQHGAMPLPPYIDREADGVDSERYQTVYAQDAGSVAAPTAGLHFDRAMLDALKAAQVQLGYVTLHVGSGTYQPVRAERLEDHKMHAEHVIVSPELVEQIKHTRASGGRVFAVGTTTLRSLESAARGGELHAFAGDTSIFIYPGFRFKVVDVLLTNFHLPESTLLMLVSALAGRERILQAYQHAIEQEYRFFSYGDCMLIECDPTVSDQPGNERDGNSDD